MNPDIIVSCERDGNESNDSDNIGIVDREIFIFGKRIRFRIAIRNEYARLRDLVPVARTVCDKLLDETLRFWSGRRGCHIACRKRCDACCSYLVPVSLPEVFCLQDAFSSMQTDDQTPILESCVRAAYKILKPDNAGPEINGDSSLRQISEWYAGLDIPCPFLSNGECSIYEQRPLACREYFVTSPPQWCRSRQSHDPQVVRLPASVAEVLGEVAARLEQSDTESVILPLALIKTDEFIERSRHRWPTADMMNLFFDVLEQATANHSEPCAVSV